MNKIGFVFSGIIIVLGISTLLGTTVLNLVVPKMGRIAFQAAANGSYTSSVYQIDFTGVNASAVGLIAGGTVLGYIFYKQESK